MEGDLISKKELLDATGISYGQLYRWKRKQLIPENWFIRKSTFTGQETFFPKHLIMPRIDKIMNMKDELSLDQLADRLSPTLLPGYELSRSEIVKRNIVSHAVMERFTGQETGSRDYSFERLLYLFVAEQLLVAGEMGTEEGERLIATLESHFPKFQDRPCDLVFTRKMGVSVFALVSAGAELFFEAGVKLVARLPLIEAIERLKGIWERGE